MSCPYSETKRKKNWCILEEDERVIDKDIFEKKCKSEDGFEKCARYKHELRIKGVKVDSEYNQGLMSTIKNIKF